MARISGVIVFLLLVLGMTGVVHGQDKIIGGEDAVDGQQDWMVALAVHSDSFVLGTDSWETYQFCGASLIDNEWVLTAAHCVDDFDADEIDVVLDIHNLTSDTGIPIPVDLIISHSSYDDTTGDSDIALLRLDTSSLDASDLATLNAVSCPSLVTASDTIEGNNATVLGWGYTEYPGGTTRSEILQQVTVPVITNTACELSFSNEGYSYDITDNMVCAGEAAGGKDSCQGDSGGPMLVNGRLAGIVSWGMGCAVEGLYGVYARVSEFLDWIDPFLLGTPPTITSTVPTDSATSVSTYTSSIRAEFSQQLDTSTITTSSFTVSDGSQNIAGTASANLTTATFRPIGALQGGRTYTVTITTNATNIAATGLQSNYTWTFTTALSSGSITSSGQDSEEDAEGGMCFIGTASSYWDRNSTY